LHTPAHALVVVQEAVSKGFRTVGQRTPTEKEQAVRPVGDGVPTPEAHLSGFGREVQAVGIAV
jgi:hypothetical protein